MKTDQVLRSILTGVGIAVAGIPVAYVLFLLPFTWLISAAAGYGAGVLINRAGGRNGGPLAIVISVLATAVPFLVLLAPNLLAGTLNPQPLIAMVFAVIAAGIANRRI
ncbi:MAG TPA: hypothetical protein VE525_10830 [Rubrobacter sp.]|jgi:hypothetical protein|nr:hypothetical protein [Rubrobacter sp.]